MNIDHSLIIFKDLLVQKLSHRIRDLRSRIKKNKHCKRLILDWDTNRYDEVARTNVSDIGRTTTSEILLS